MLHGASTSNAVWSCEALIRKLFYIDSPTIARMCSLLLEPSSQSALADSDAMMTDAPSSSQTDSKSSSSNGVTTRSSSHALSEHDPASLPRESNSSGVHDHEGLDDLARKAQSALDENFVKEFVANEKCIFCGVDVKMSSSLGEKCSRGHRLGEFLRLEC